MSSSDMRRVCQIIKVISFYFFRNLTKHAIQLKPARVDEYKQIHAAVWPGVLAALKRAHITDYSIHHYPPLQLLIATFKYTGDDYAADMAKVAEDPETQRWWALTDEMQESFVEGTTGSGKDVPWWQVNHHLQGMQSFAEYRFGLHRKSKRCSGLKREGCP